MASGYMDFIIGGHVDKTNPSCPIQESSVITPDLINIYQESIDLLIHSLGKHILLEFDPIKTMCPNCEYDTVRAQSRNVYKTGGPIPFSGTKCPYCKGIGYTDSVVNECIQGLIQFNSKDYLSYGIPLQEDGTIIRIKTFLTHLPSLARCRDCIIDYDITGITRIKAKILRAPIPIGLQTSRYCVSFWKVVDRP